MHAFERALENLAGRMFGKIGGDHLPFRPHQDARDIEGDIAIADDDRRLDIEIGHRLAEFRMAVIPVDKNLRAEDTGLVLSGDAETAVLRRACGDHHHVIQFAQLVERDIRGQADIADEADIVILHHLVIGAGDGLGGLVVRGDPGADQPVGRRQFIENIYDTVGVFLDDGACGIHPCRPRTDDTNL